MPQAGERTVTPAPAFGEAVRQAIGADVWRRDKNRDLSPLARLWPLLMRHWPEALAGLTFLLLSTAALLALTGGARMVLDEGFALQNRATLQQVFLWLGATAGALAITTGLRLYFTYKLGERIIADLRAQKCLRAFEGLRPPSFRREQSLNCVADTRVIIDDEYNWGIGAHYACSTSPAGSVN